MKLLFRRFIRFLLKYLCIITINKHSLDIITVGGWYGTDIAREAVYVLLKHSGKKVRRIIHNPTIDWDIPLTILGVRTVPKTFFGWIYVISSTLVRLIILKPNPSILVLQINSHDAGIMKYWMEFITPTHAIMLNSHVGTLNLELLIVEKLKQSGYLILNNDNARTKSLAQGKKDHSIYFGQHLDPLPDFYFFHDDKKGKLVIGTSRYAKEEIMISKTFPEFVYPFITGAVALSSVYGISLEQACDALAMFELPSDKIQTIFHRFIEE